MTWTQQSVDRMAKSMSESAVISALRSVRIDMARSGHRMSGVIVEHARPNDPAVLKLNRMWKPSNQSNIHIKAR